MTRNLLRAGALSCALLTSTALCTQPALAQSAPAFTEFRTVDANGVDLVNGGHMFSFEEGAIGSGRARLSLVRVNAQYGDSQYDGIRLIRTSDGTNAPVEVRLPGGVSETFAFGTNTPNGTTVTRANGSRLTKQQRHLYTYVAADGTVIIFGDPTQSYDSGNPPNGFCSVNAQSFCELLPETMGGPDGRVLSFTHDTYGMPDGSGGVTYETRLAKVANSFGYSVSFSYQDDSQNWGSPPSTGWKTRTGADFRNETLSSSVQSSVSYAYPSSGVVEITDMAGQVWRISATATSTGIRRPGASSDTFTVSSSNGVLTVTNEGVATTYSRVVSGTTATMTVTDALTRQTVIVSDLTKGRPTSVTDPLNRQTQYTYDTSNRLTRITAHEGNYVQYTLDGRGNATSTSFVPKSGSGLSTITTSASFPSSCTSTTTATCNLPTSVTDARGNVTDFTYDSTHGGVLTKTGPAPGSGAARPQTRYSYTLTNGEYLLTGLSACATATTSDPASCVGTANESRTIAAYDSNGNVTSVTNRDGTGNLSAVQAMTYDARGNLLTIDGPLSGTADTIRMRYDAGNRLIGAVGPDPDGSGSLLHRAMRVTFTNGLPTKQEVGTVASQSDSDWAAFSTSQEVQTVFDANARPTVQKLVSGSTTYSLTQVSYDALGRAECVAQRMNPSEFTSLPSSACTLDTEGSFGPDRIVKTSFDHAGQVSLVQSGYGVTGVQADEVSATYTNNGQLETLTDGEGNKTTYVYDGHDRLSRTRFPSTTQGAGTSSTTDYEELSYDAGGNVTNRRLRDNTNIGFTYDALNRPTFKDRPGSEPDISYGYDLLGRMTSAGQAGYVLSFGFDALGRLTTQTSPRGTMTSTFDAAGNRTRLSWPGNTYYVDYDHDASGALTKVRENGATSGLGVTATYAHDDLGRVTSLTRGNGVVTSYGYDAVSRLSSLAHDLNGTTGDVTFSYSHNPAGQIVSRTASNDAYSVTGMANQNKTDTHNGLNQVTQTGSTSVTHDARGNVTSAPGTAYGSPVTLNFGYDSENRLISASGGRFGSMGLAYDPLGRLYGEGSWGWPEQQWDGDQMATQYLASGDYSRNVYDGGLGAPLMETGPNHQWFNVTDERGSVIARTDTSGNLSSGTPISTYDDYGKNNAGAEMRYQYTGQFWLVGIAEGVYYMRNRVYLAELGRFAQSDPIGYGDGMNRYAYVGGDPVNLVDPSGLEERCFRVRDGGYQFETTDEDGTINIHVVAVFAAWCYNADRPVEFMRWTVTLPPCPFNRGHAACMLARYPEAFLKPLPPATSACVNGDGTVTSERRGSNMPLFGDVWARGGHVTGMAGGGGAIESGRWYDRHTGASGEYSTTYIGLGVGGGAGGVVTNFSDLASFSGVSWGVSGANPIFGLGAAQSTTGGWGHSVSAGISTPRLSGARANTQITSGLRRC